MADEQRMSKLQAKLQRPPENWVDAIVIAVVKDPYFYGGAVLAVFLVLSIMALWATRELLRSIEKEERAAKKETRRKKAGEQAHADDKKSQ